jgi:hypothetical protein
VSPATPSSIAWLDFESAARELGCLAVRKLHDGVGEVLDVEPDRLVEPLGPCRLQRLVSGE